MKRALLLGGTSLQTLEDHIEQLNAADCQFYIINRKAHLEAGILSKIGRTADYWCVLSPPELEHLRDEVLLFLEAAGNGRLITSSAALEKAFGETPPSSPKILQADAWIRAAYDTYHQLTGKPPLGKLIEADGALNTLFVLLLGLLMEDSRAPIYLFGSDGAASDYKKAGDFVYFGMDLEEQIERTKSSNIYNDMVNFERYWKPCLRHFGLSDACITNVNPQSHYTAFRTCDFSELTLSVS